MIAVAALLAFAWFLAAPAAEVEVPMSEPAINRSWEALSPAAQAVYPKWLAAAILAARPYGYTVRVIETLRATARQAWLYASGRTRPGPILTRAPPGEGDHEAGNAWDWVLVNLETNAVAWYRGEDVPLRNAYRAVGEASEALGLEWGGRYRDAAGHLDQYGIGWDQGHVAMRSGAPA